MKAIVTGGAGFIGSHLVDAMLNENIDVTVLDNFSTGRPENLAHVSEQIKLVECDLSFKGDWIKHFDNAENDTLIVNNYKQFKSKNVIIDNYLTQCPDVYGYGAGQMTPILAYHLPSKLSAIEAIIDDDSEKDGTYFDYIKPKIVNSSQIDLASATVFITSVDAAATITKNITARKVILPNILLTM